MCYDKPEIQRIKASELFALAEELFEKGQSIRFVVSGDSMYPFIRNNRDMVTLAGATLEQVKVSDIVLAIRKSDKSYVLHRVFKKSDKDFYMVGDNQQWLDGPYAADALIGVVTEVYRVGSDGTSKKMGGVWYKLLVRLWMLVRPFRSFLKRAYGWVRRRMKHGKSE